MEDPSEKAEKQLEDCTDNDGGVDAPAACADVGESGGISNVLGGLSEKAEKDSDDDVLGDLSGTAEDQLEALSHSSQAPALVLEDIRKCTDQGMAAEILDACEFVDDVRRRIDQCELDDVVREQFRSKVEDACDWICRQQDRLGIRSSADYSSNRRLMQRPGAHLHFVDE